MLDLPDETGLPATTAVPAAAFAVLGSPIAHSKSPAIHAAAYRELGLDWTYSRRELTAEALSSFVSDLAPEWRGLSLTMPLKEEAYRLARVLDPVAEESGVVNTLLRLSGAAGWAGFNTDVGGLAAAISRAGLDATNAIVLGSGATAVSAILAARSLGAERITIAARNAEAVAGLVTRFDRTRARGDANAPLRVSAAAHPLSSEDASGATLVISALPGSAAATVVLPESVEMVPLFDVAYDPWPSPLAARWADAGGVAHPGTAMLVEQALLQVRIFVAGDPAIGLPHEERVLAAMRGAAGLPDMER